MCPQGSLRADFYFQGTFHRHRRFPCLGHIQGSRLITRHLTDTEDFLTQGTFRALRALRADFLTYPFINFQIMKFYKKWIWCKFYLKTVYSEKSLSHTYFHYVILFLRKFHFYQFCEFATMYLYDTIFKLHSLLNIISKSIKKKVKDLIFIIKKY